MTLVSNWRTVLRNAWSVRFSLLATVFGSIDVALQYLDGALPIPQRSFAGLMLLSSLLAGVSRVVAQSTIPPKE